MESARRAKGLSQAEAIRYTGDIIASSALSLAEHERREMSIDKLKLLAGLYEVRTEWLVTGVGPRMINEPDAPELDESTTQEPEPEEREEREEREPDPITLVRPKPHGRSGRRRPKRA